MNETPRQTQTVAATTNWDVRVLHPSIAVTKRCTPNPSLPGQPINFDGTVTNNGDHPLTALEVADDHAGPVLCRDAGGNPVTSLAPGQSCTYSGSYTPNSCTDTTDTVTATANTNLPTASSNCPATVSATASASCPVLVRPSATLTKTCSPNPVPVGMAISFSGVLTNTGNVALSCTLSDDHAGPVLCRDAGGSPVTSLAAGASCSYFGSYQPRDCTDDTDTVTASCVETCFNGNVPVLPASATCPIRTNPNITVTKTCQLLADNATIEIGGVVTNTGDIRLINLRLSDDHAGPLTCRDGAGNAVTALDPSASCSYTGTYAVTCPGGPFTDVVTATATPDCPGLADVSATANCTVPCRVTETCRTPGFWGTHARQNAVKVCSQDITGAVINWAGGLSVCGYPIQSTPGNPATGGQQAGFACSSTEALCVRVQGNPARQLARQLTAAALNCVVSGSPGNADCTGSSIETLFAECNNICINSATSTTSEITSCIARVDCFNNGGSWDATLGTCVPGIPDANCHDRALPLADIPGLPNNNPASPCFGRQGPAGSSGWCNQATESKCTFVGGTRTHCQSCP